MRSGHGLGTHAYSGIPANRFIRVVEVHSFADCQRVISELPLVGFKSWLESARDVRNRVKLGRNVWLDQMQDGTFAVRLYDTPVLRYYPDGTWSADDGGFNTLTTSTRLTQFSPGERRRFYFYHHQSKLGAVGAGWPLDHSRRFDIEGKEVEVQS